MNTKPSLGTGFAGVWAQAVAAGIMASRRGRARAACVLFRNVRLGIAFLVRNIALSFYLATAPSRSQFRAEIGPEGAPPATGLSPSRLGDPSSFLNRDRKGAASATDVVSARRI